VLASPFMQALLHYYRVELHHLAPNSISQVAIFAAVCEGYLGMEPQRGVRRVVHAGSCTLQVWSGRGNQYIPMQLISSNSG
jgi:hypothetical protein